MEQDQIMKRRIRPYPENVEHGVEGELRCVQGITSSNTVPPGSYVSLRQFWRIAALESNRLAHARIWTVQRDLYHEEFRYSVLFFPYKVAAR